MPNRQNIDDVYKYIEHQAAALGDNPFILFGDKAVSFKEFNQKTCQAANGLVEQGAKPGEGVAILMENCPEYLYFVYGVPRAGIYSVPVNTSLEGDGLRHILTNSDVRFLIVDDGLYPRIAKLGLPAGAIKKIFIRQTTNTPLPPETSDMSLLLEGSLEFPNDDSSAETIFSIVYTSGTTALPKGVVKRRRSANFKRLFDLAGQWLTEDDVLFTTLPLYHSNALFFTARLAMMAGIPFGLETHFDPSVFWHRIRHYGATVFNGLAGMLPVLLREPQQSDDLNNPVRLVISAACPANLWEQFEKRFGLTIWEIYSAVDIGHVQTLNNGSAPIGSVGKPVNAEWRLIDDKGSDVPSGQCGELIVRNNDLQAGKVEYYKNPEASLEKVQDGWVHTGDMFYADKMGNLYFVDRKNDSIQFFGEEISSVEIETVVMTYPGIDACAAGAVPTDDHNEEVMIWVKAKNGEPLDLKGLIYHCLDNMAYFMAPRFIEVVKDIPVTDTLKVKKVELIKKGVNDQTWDRKKEMPELKLNPLYSV
jgi:carnitine-CoA ligase